MSSDRVVVMAAGRVAEAGPPAELARREGGAFAALLARANAVHADADADADEGE